MTNFLYIYIGADDSETETDEERREIQAAMEKASKEKAILLQYRDAIKAATEIGLDYTTLNPEELISMFMAGELDPTHQEEARQNVKCGKEERVEKVAGQKDNLRRGCMNMTKHVTSMKKICMTKN